MKCRTCGYDNLLKANYCCSCGTAFTAEEKEAAKKASLGGRMEKTEKVVKRIITVKDILTLSFLTKNVFVRTFLILLPLLSAVFAGQQMAPSSLTILEDDGYVIHQNTDTQAYYVDTDAQMVNLKLYVPKDTESVEVAYYAESETPTYSNTYTLSDSISVNAVTQGYYIVTAHTSAEDQSITLYTV